MVKQEYLNREYPCEMQSQGVQGDLCANYVQLDSSSTFSSWFDKSNEAGYGHVLEGLGQEGLVGVTYHADRECRIYSLSALAAA